MERALFDTPVELAILRAAAKAGRRWLGVQDLRKAVEWLEAPEYTITVSTWRRLECLVDLGVLEARRAVGASSGREWRLVGDNGALKRATGGIDVLRLDREEALQASDNTTTRRVEFTPDAYLHAPGNPQKAARALRQCPSPWALADRMTKIKWTNPETV